MAENFLGNSQAIEAEIAQLQKMIEVKRNQLEAQSGIVEEKELVRSAIQEMITESAETDSKAALSQPVVAAKTKVVPTGNASGASYLDRLDDESAVKLNAYIAEIGQHGIVRTLNKVVAEEPFIIDAFHDVLVDKLYEELKTKGLIK
ncbi:MAG TPA: hypothetical protein PKN73_00760 [Candidatus Paceibacterota bacterium]|jgi:hypothetical protein|nr:hypothetical protein [Candidatus Paceibacterota bacterium]HOH11175.1 hypothetical protein [Candidatus Paceibacterota bacterium]HOY11321.1 hypothetical protein [Candidatus Paceibacterota bacterium]HPB60584.1 hypothetical protein [Candidatus Paceibacterota bacterium]HPN89596.1 hypothetical protein [Candidatus Paceibacterota bacterium]